MVETGALRVQRTGILQATGGAGRTELDREILGLVHSRPLTVPQVRRQLRKHHAADEIKQQL